MMPKRSRSQENDPAEAPTSGAADAAEQLALICEECGYPLDQSECPECGTPRESSLPSNRPGSTWQRKPSVASYFLTLRELVLRPGALFRSLSIREKGWRALLWANLVLAAFLIVDPWVGVLVGDPARNARGASGWAMHGAVLVVETGAVAGLLWLLVYIERRGVVFFSRQRGWRVTREVAAQVCAHASYAWILSGLLPMLLMGLQFVVLRVFQIGPSGSISLQPLANVRLDWTQITTGGAVFLGWFAGLLVFETLVYVGVRRCRYANVPGAGRLTANGAEATAAARESVPA